jgi:O-antigen/teichoic acid export membrane protein
MTRKALAIYVGRLFSSGSTVLLLAAVGRRLGADALGVVGIGMAAGILLSAVTDGAANLLVVRTLARSSNAAQIVGAVTLFRLVSVPIGLACALVVLTLWLPSYAVAIWLACGWVTIQQFTEVSRSVLVWADRVGWAALHTSVENLIWVGVMLALLLAGCPIEVVFAGGLAVIVLSSAVGFVLLRLLLGWFPARPSMAAAREVLSDFPPFVAYSILGGLYARVDTILIGALLPGGVAVAGAYFAAMRLVAGLEYLPDAVSRALYPDVARAYVVNPRSPGLMMARPIELLLWISVPVPLVAFFAADWGFPIIFGPEVVGYGWILVVVSFFVPIRFIGSLLGVVLTSGGAQAKRAAAVALAAVLVVSLDIILLPRIGLVAAVIAMASAWLSTFVIYLVQTSRGFGLPPLLGPAARSIACAAAAFAAGLAARLIMPESIAAPGAAALFGTAYAMLWAFVGPAVRMAGKLESATRAV